MPSLEAEECCLAGERKGLGGQWGEEELREGGREGMREKGIRGVPLAIC